MSRISLYLTATNLRDKDRGADFFMLHLGEHFPSLRHGTSIIAPLLTDCCQFITAARGLQSFVASHRLSCQVRYLTNTTLPYSVMINCIRPNTISGGTLAPHGVGPCTGSRCFAGNVRSPVGPTRAPVSILSTIVGFEAMQLQGLHAKAGIWEIRPHAVV